MIRRILGWLLSALGIGAVGLLALAGAQVMVEDWLRPETSSTTISGTVVVEEIRRVNKQVFIEQYQSVPITQREAPQSLGDILRRIGIQQTFVVLIRGTVPAGIDLSALTEADIWISTDGRRVQLTLPQPQIFSSLVALDPANSMVLSEHDFCPGLLCQTDMQVMQKEILPAGQEALITSAYQSGILEKTAEEAEAYYTQFLLGLGAEEVRVVVSGYTAP